MELKIDPQRQRTAEESLTGIFVRAQDSEGKWGNADIAELDRPSYEEFCKSRGEVSQWAMSILFHLMGHPMTLEENNAG